MFDFTAWLLQACFCLAPRPFSKITKYMQLMKGDLFNYFTLVAQSGHFQHIEEKYDHITAEKSINVQAGYFFFF